jgi:hypothetical protein
MSNVRDLGAAMLMRVNLLRCRSDSGNTLTSQ